MLCSVHHGTGTARMPNLPTKLPNKTIRLTTDRGQAMIRTNLPNKTISSFLLFRLIRIGILFLDLLIKIGTGQLLGAQLLLGWCFIMAYGPSLATNS